jgi:hypothetical protein
VRNLYKVKRIEPVETVQLGGVAGDIVLDLTKEEDSDVLDIRPCKEKAYMMPPKLDTGSYQCHDMTSTDLYRNLDLDDE